MSARKEYLYVLGLVVLVFVQLACNVTSNVAPSATPTTVEITATPTAQEDAGTNTPVPTVTSTATANKAPSSTPTATTTPEEVVELDPCSLMTAEEVEALLGLPIGVEPQSGLGSCTFAAQSSIAEAPKTLTIGAAQGDEAKSLAMVSAQIILIFAQDEQVHETFQTISENITTTTVSEVVIGLNSIYGMLGYTAADRAGATDVSTWLTQPDLQTGTLNIVDGDMYYFATVTGLQEELALAAAESAVTLVAARLPLRFSVPVSGRFGFEMELPTIEVTLAPPEIDVTPTPTPTDTPAPTATATPVPTQPPEEPAFVELPSYAGDCAQRPEGSVCIGFRDGYIWLVYDGITGRRDGEPWQGQEVEIAEGYKADYYHVLGTAFVMEVSK